MENQRKFGKRGTAINTLFVVLMLLSAAFCKVNDIRSHKCSPVRRSPYVPRLSFKPFYVAISEGSHVDVGIPSKATDREGICLQTLSLFLFCFFHTPRVLHVGPVLSTSHVFHTPVHARFPDSPYPVPGPWPRVFHLAETATILPAALHKLLA